MRSSVTRHSGWFHFVTQTKGNETKRVRSTGFRGFEAWKWIDLWFCFVCVLKILFVLYRIDTSVRFVGCSLLTDALTAKFDAQNAFELAENLLVRDSLALLVLLNNLRLFVDLLRQLRLRELLRQSTLKNRLLHVGAHRLVRQVFVVELELERVTSRPRVYARAVNNKKISSVSQSLYRCVRFPLGFNRPSSVSSFARVSLSLVALSRRSYPSSPFAPPYQPEAPERVRKTPFSSSVSHHPPSSSVRSHPASTPTRRQREEIRISNRHHVSMVKSSHVESRRRSISSFSVVVARTHRRDGFRILRRFRRPTPRRARSFPNRNLLPILVVPRHVFW